jgi:hypothetical protein
LGKSKYLHMFRTIMVTAAYGVSNSLWRVQVVKFLILPRHAIVSGYAYLQLIVVIMIRSVLPLQLLNFETVNV